MSRSMISSVPHYKLRVSADGHLHVLARVQQHQVVNKALSRAVDDLRELRNRVAHGRHNPSSGEAVAYVESTKELSRAAHILASVAAAQNPTTLF
jgi:hypothetical protein